jgi:hypothetical protein
MFKSRIMYLWFIFVSLIYLPSSRFCDFVGSFREKKKKKEEIIVFTKQFLPFTFMTNYREAKYKFHIEYILGGFVVFRGAFMCV